MTKSKGGEAIDAATCENPVMDHMKLGVELGISGTPAMVFEDGTLVPGYVPADRLSAMLNEAE